METTLPEKDCPTCGLRLGRMWKRDTDRTEEYYCDNCSKLSYYKDNYLKAIEDSLNVLGRPIACKGEHCEGCQVEREEATDILMAAIGLNHTVQDYDKWHDQWVANANRP